MAGRNRRDQNWWGAVQGSQAGEGKKGGEIRGVGAGGPGEWAEPTKLGEIRVLKAGWM